MRTKLIRLAVALAAVAAFAACSSELPTEDVAPSAAPSRDGGGWIGGGGRSDADSTNFGVGWIGGGGLLEVPDSTSTR